MRRALKPSSKQLNNTNNTSNNNNNNNSNNLNSIPSSSSYSTSTSDYDDGLPDLQPIEVRRVPADQIEGLSEEQKNEVFTKLLTALDPNVSTCTTRFNYENLEFKLSPSLTHMAVHFDMESVLIHVDSDEARDQINYAAEQKDREQIEKKNQITTTDEEQKENTGNSVPNTASPTAVTTSISASTSISTSTTLDPDEEDPDSLPRSDRALKNQFNFSERASQTFNNPLRDREISTEPPPTTEFGANVTHWEIFDTYVEDVEKTNAAKAAKESKASKKLASGANGAGEDDFFAGPNTAANGNNNTDSSSSTTTSALFQSDSLAFALKTMERLVNQNAESELFHDYKYYEDKSELKREANIVVNSNSNSTSHSSHALSSTSTMNSTTSTTSSTSSSLSSSFRGSFLPLWKFVYERARKKTVTCITWNPEFCDLFAVSYGSYDFQKQNSGGIICCFTLKNTQFPEYKFHTESGVMCLQFHPHYSALLVAGLYDGTVCVFDVRSKTNQPLYTSTNPQVKHTDPVWQVHWQKDTTTTPTSSAATTNSKSTTSSSNPSAATTASSASSSSSDKHLNFYSISSDGRVTNWIINKNELINEELTQLKLIQPNKKPQKQQEQVKNSGIGAIVAVKNNSEMKENVDETNVPPPTSTTTSSASDSPLVGLAGGCCFDFNPHIDHYLIVGTEEGSIHLYSKAYNCQFLKSFVGHAMSVYAIRWNPFHPGVFLSCSADWTVKLWELTSPNPVMTFDLNCSVGDISWSPYSSTVFSVVTSDGKVRVYDLSMNKHEAIGETRIATTSNTNTKLYSKLTHISFNPKNPIVCVGDDKGVVNILKLSNNLRQSTAPSIDELDQQEEIDKLDRLLIIPDRPNPPPYLKQYLSQHQAVMDLKNGKGKAAVGKVDVLDEDGNVIKSTAAVGGKSGLTSPRTPSATGGKREAAGGGAALSLAGASNTSGSTPNSGRPAGGDTSRSRSSSRAE